MVSKKPVLCISDTSEINLQRHKGKLSRTDTQLGPVGNNSDIGFFIHPSLVIDASNLFPLGFSSLIIWNRKWAKKSKNERCYKKQPLEEKESYQRVVGAQESQSCLTTAEQVTLIGDRESDFFEELALVPNYQRDLLVRACQDRCI